jgi:hypothetical protein
MSVLSREVVEIVRSRLFQYRLVVSGICRVMQRGDRCAALLHIMMIVTGVDSQPYPKQEKAELTKGLSFGSSAIFS